MTQSDTNGDVEVTFHPQEWTDSPGEAHEQGRKQLIPAPEHDPVTFTVPREDATHDDVTVFADESYEANQLQTHPAAPNWVTDWDGPYYILTDGGMAVTEDEIDPERSLGALVRENPAFASVFETLGIDFCCGGDQTLQAACEEANLDLDEVRRRLLDSRREEGDEHDEWESPSTVVDDVVTTHHQYLREELPALGDLVEKVRSVHGDSHPELVEVDEEFDELADEIRRHIDEEEDDVFPVVEKLERGEELSDHERTVLEDALDDLEDDHEATAAHLERIADLTDDYAVPADACPSYQSMLERLEALERDTHKHVHKENNVLFPMVESELAEC